MPKRELDAEAPSRRPEDDDLFNDSDDPLPTGSGGKRPRRNIDTPPPDSEMVWLNHWSVTSKRPSNPYQCPDAFGVRVLSGSVVGHPKLEDGDSMVSSALLYMHGQHARTVTRWYFLGKVDPEYEKYMSQKGLSALQEDAIEVNRHVRIKGWDEQ